MRAIVVGCLAAITVIALSPEMAEAQRRFGGGLRNVGSAVGEAVGVEVPPEVTEETLLPSQVGSAWAALDDANPLASAEQPVRYAVTTMENYDAFFLEAAKLQGALELARHTAALLNETLRGPLVDELLSGQLLGDAIDAASLPPEDRRTLFVALLTGNFGSFSAHASSLPRERFEEIRASFMSAHPEVQQLRDLIPAAITTLGTIPEMAQTLIGQAEQLAASAPSDFTGAHAINLPRITEELAETGRSLQSAAGTSASLLEELRQIVPAQ